MGSCAFVCGANAVPHARFLWSDASPKMGRDWLLCREVAVRADEFDAVITAADTLSGHSQACLQKHFFEPDSGADAMMCCRKQCAPTCTFQWR